LNQRFHTCLQILCLIFAANLETIYAQNQSAASANSPKQAHTPTIAQAANNKEREISALIERAESHYDMAMMALAQNNIAQTRAQFDAAVDELLNAGVDLNANARLLNYYRELVDKIFHQQAALKSRDDNHQFSPQNSSFYETISLTDEDLNKFVINASDQPPAQASDFSFPIDLPPAVNQFINYFTNGKGRQTIETGFARSGKYRKLAEDIFEQAGVPKDLIWLAQVESVWQPSASSSASARGIWQFIPSTGSRFGLRQDSWCDERLDPEKSTQAAAQYLRFLADRYAGNWLLAMAAYNYGENGIDRAIDRCGYADFWALSKQNLLPQETKNYVPAILAVIAIAKHPEAYGLNIGAHDEWQFDKISVCGSASLHTVASRLKVPLSTISNYNPQLIAGVTPPEGYTLRVPLGVVNAEAISMMQSLPRNTYHIRNSSVHNHNNSYQIRNVVRRVVVRRVAVKRTLVRRRR
jgi:membrane-bound lytic murein transglycosylase D